MLSNCQVILVGPMYGGNVGACARAIKNTGMGGLTVVSPTYEDENEARKFCHGAEEIYDCRDVHEHLVDALDGRRVVVGFTARQRHRRHYKSLREFAEEWVRAGADVDGPAETALLFGRERDGLSNSELDLCSDLVWIPAHPGHMSYNLAQAVLLTGYELFMAQLQFDPDAPVAVPRRTRPVSPGKRVDGKDLEDLLAHLRAAFLSIGYCYDHTVDAMVRSYAEVFARAKLYQREARMIRGLARQMEWAAKQMDGNEEE